MRLLEKARELFRLVSSGHYRVTSRDEATEGWRDTRMAERQHGEYGNRMRELREGRPRLDLQIAGEAVCSAGIADPTLIEIGCGSGYYSEILSTLAGVRRYFGIDYSAAMIDLARQVYPRQRFAVADATSLPFGDATFDIVFSGNSLMHVAGYASSIDEIARVARRWCVFHSVPVLEHRATTRLRKSAYGIDVFELTFNRKELETLFEQNGLRIHSSREGVSYDLANLLGEPTRLLTYSCEKR